MFGQDLDGDGSIWSIANVNLSAVTVDGVQSDTSTSGNSGKGVALKKDAQGTLFVEDGSDRFVIVDSSDAPVAFDWTDTWGGYTSSSAAYAVEGIDSDGNAGNEKYKLAIRYRETDNSSGNSYESWKTYLLTPNISNQTAALDWSTGTWGEAKIHEVDLNQDLDGDGTIWTRASIISSLTSIGTDSSGAIGKLDVNNNLYIVSADGQTTREVLDQGGLVSFNNSYSDSYYSYSESVYAVEAIDTDPSDSNNIDAYKVLIQGSSTYDSVTTNYYKTVNVDILSTSALSVDWSSFAYYDEPKQLEKVFSIDLDGDGSFYDPSTQAKTKVSTVVAP